MTALHTFDTIRSRRAVKHYDSAHQFTPAEEQQLFELAQQTPSSFNIQHWRFVKITDKILRIKIREAAWNQAQVTDAAMLLVICADIKAWEKSPGRYWTDAPAATREALVPMIEKFYQGKDQLQRDEAMRSVGFVGQTLMLAAKAMGYDSSPMIGFDQEKVAELVKLPADHAIGMMLAIGKAAKPANAKGGYLPLNEILVENTF